GLNHVLRNFTQYPHRSNYFFPSSGVRSYLGSKLFGAHLGDAIVNTPLVTGHGLHHALWMWQVAPAAIPLMIIAAIATHCTARRSVHRPLSMNVAGTAQSVTMGRIAMWVLPLGVLAFGVVLPVGLLLYLASNNIWTLVQQHLVFVRIDRGEEKQQAKAQHQRSALAPKPGQKPGVAKNARP
ncbi:MAG: YidC/Oxa1 family membrane protein insertase, partial [Gammaproteobacteria bacterium]